MRAFVALELPDAIRAACRRKLERLRQLARIRLTPARNLHVTLAFLGDIDDEQAGPIAEALRAGLAGAPAWTLHVQRVGAFPGGGRPRVLWCGVEDLMGRCADGHDRVWGALEPFGFERETRPFRPHITFGRIRSGRIGAALRDALRASEEFDAGAAPVERVVLMQSELTPQGAEYSDVASFPF